MRELELAARVRSIMAGRPDVREQAVIGGGLGFMVGPSLCCVVQTDGVAVRVGEPARAAALAQPHVYPHTVGSRVTSAFVLVRLDALGDDESLESWIQEGIRCVEGLAPRSG